MQGRNRDTKVKNGHVGISLVVHQLRLHTLNAEGLGSISGQGTNLTCLQLRAGATKFKKKKKKKKNGHVDTAGEGEGEERLFLSVKKLKSSVKEKEKKNQRF